MVNEGMDTNTYLRVLAFFLGCTSIYIYTHSRTHVCMYVCMYVYLYVCVLM